MKRVIFVDDDTQVLGALRRSMFDLADEWDMCFVDTGAAALAEVASNGADVVVSDMRMPTMDGAALLERLQAEHPQVARLVLSGHADTAALMRALPVAHTLLNKPCRNDDLVQAIRYALEMHTLVRDETLRDAAARAPRFPTRPRSYGKLLQLIGHPATTTVMLAQAVGADKVLSSKVISMANSAAFGRGAQCSRVEQAIARMGGELLLALVLGIEVTEAMRSCATEVDAIHSHSMRVGLLARKLCRPALAEAALLNGIVHDVGQLVLLHDATPELRRGVAQEDAAAVAELEVRAGGISHARLGAYVLGLWGMSYEVLGAVARHHEPLHELPAELSAADALRVATALLEGRSCDDPRWRQWTVLADQVRDVAT